jgi:ubiquinone/menaquinone biosynthesis C-methylase UbiE
MHDLLRRAEETELMDDLSRPDSEFEQAYRELAVINRWLGGIRAIKRFLPARDGLTILDVAAGGGDVGEAIAQGRNCTIVSLDLNRRGLRYCRRTLPLVGDAMALPFSRESFDIVMCSLFFHHLTNDGCVQALKEMWRTASNLVIVNDLHRHPIAHASIDALSSLFSKSVMVKHDGPASVRRAFRPAELLEIARRGGIPARVYRSFPYRLVLVAGK